MAHSPVRAAAFLQIAKIYDCLLTLDMEVEYIWKANWGVGKILFLLERYMALISAPVMVYYSLASDLSNE
ncbi:hypothetical protein C0992_007457, partial [Termitomyces sp. T32_za158]